MRKVRVGLAGLGTVGYGTYAVLNENAQVISSRSGVGIEVACAVVRNVAKAKEKTGGKLPIQTDFHAILDDPTIDIVVEVMGGVEPARTLILDAIARGKHVVTANKHLIATQGEEIFHAAQERGVTVAYEAAVAGGIPIIKALREGLAADRIESVSGIVNGTSNFILTMMREKGVSFSEALHQAQELGYAEADPTFDIEGIDAAHKMTILAGLAFGTPFNYEAAVTQGISSLQARDISIADALGYRIKLIGQAKRTTRGIELGVHPRLVRKESLFSQIDGVMNAVEVQADGLGPTFYSGRGAGERPTASAVVADIIDIARTIDVEPCERVPMTGVLSEARSLIEYVSREETESRFYVRVDVHDQTTAREVFEEFSIGVEFSRLYEDQTVFLLEKTSYGQFDAALEKIASESSVKASPVGLFVFDS